MGSAVLAAPASPPAELRLRPLATWPVLTIAGLVAVAHLVTSAFGDYWIDEVYMLAAGKYHPDWGYVDQPPVAPLIAAAMDWIAPGSMVVLRLPAVLATAAGVVVFALLALAGFGVGGQQLALNYLIANAYPAQLRATATGWGIGLGRVGSILGSASGGFLLDALGVAGYFLSLAVPLAFAGAAALLVKSARGPEEPAPDPFAARSTGRP